MNSATKSRSETVSMLLAVTSGNRAASRRKARSMRKARARQSAPRRAACTFTRSRQSRSRALVAVQHLPVGQKIVSQEHRLRLLQMRVPGQDRIAFLLGQRQQTPPSEQISEPSDLRRFHPGDTSGHRARPDRCGSGRYEACPPAAPIRSIRAFSIAMWISSSLDGEGKPSPLDIPSDPFKPGNDLFPLAAVMIPWRASIWQWAMLPSIS